MTHFAKCVVLAGVCGFFAGTASAQWVADQSVPTKLTEDAVVDLVNTVLLFDRLFTKPTTETSKGYLERVSAPSSRFYRDYLDYKEGRISRSQLVDRLPHIAMIGDSLSQHFYISSPASMLWRARTERQRDWFLDTDPAPSSVLSLYERLDAVTPLVGTEYSTPGALVAPGHATETFVRRLARTQNMRRQISRLTQVQRFPDVILLWIGHNNTDWVSRLSEAERNDPLKGLPRLAKEFETSYADQLQPLIERAEKEKHPVAVVVFGLADFETFFEMRAKAAAAHASDPTRYPYYDKTCQYFEALQPANQKTTTRLGLMMNQELRKMVARLRRQESTHPNVRLEYSDALTKIRLSDLKGFSLLDAWHPSVLGHDEVASKAFDAIAPSLAFVGVDPKSRRSTGEHIARIKSR